jgi:hypothetical protein
VSVWEIAQYEGLEAEIQTQAIDNGFVGVRYPHPASVIRHWDCVKGSFSERVSLDTPFDVPSPRLGKGPRDGDVENRKGSGLSAV